MTNELPQCADEDCCAAPWTSQGLFTFLPPCVSFPEYIQRYATEEALKEQEEGGGDSSSESSMSDFSEDEAQDMEL